MRRQDRAQARREPPTRQFSGNKEALPLLLTLSSGVKGYTTIHAGSARQALTRLRFIAQLAGSSADMPMAALSSLVSEAVDIVVHCERSAERLRVAEVIAVEEPQTGPDAMAFTVTELFGRTGPDADLTWTGNLPVRASRSLSAAGYDIRSLLGDVAPRRPRRPAAGRAGPRAPTTAGSRS